MDANSTAGTGLDGNGVGADAISADGLDADGLDADGWTNPEDVLAKAIAVLQAPRPQLLPRLSQVLADLVPHRVIAQLSGVCSHSPTKADGDRELAARVSSSELGRLADRASAGRPWQGEAVLAGAARPTLAVASAPAGTNGALLVLVRTRSERLPERTLAIVQRIWDLFTVHANHRAADAAPVQAATSRAAAGARARAIAELTDAHASALSAILGTLRATGLDDGTARRAAVDLTVASMIELRASADLDRSLSEEPATEAFGRLTDELRPLLRHSPVRLDLRPPATGRTLPADIAHSARAAVRSTVLAMLEQDGLQRLHVAWQVEEDTLRVTVRDDGPGLPAEDAPALRRTTDRLTALGGRLTVDAVPGWGSTVTATLPLGPPATPIADPLDGLHPRELEVLDQLALGRRNRDIAQALHISESTVKFHVANILGKLGVSSRGEAAALAHRTGLTMGGGMYAVS
ncbi:LuxR C-terminal-related transcriptional regulator [Kitasatospora sp. NPDC050543]|uniref:helix-turn-helix transcriptional regulator n=1 Tax=Kitasatospora sp. NPDC050543 TaxID=3364054 RepID=UPI00378F3296